MSAHPDILELELLRTGEAEPETGAHVATCEACRAQVEGLSQLASGSRLPPVNIPAAVEGRIRERARRIRPAGPFRGRALTGWMASAGAAAALFLATLTFFGDNLRAQFGASADALAGSESSHAEDFGEEHRSVRGFGPARTAPIQSLRLTLRGDEVRLTPALAPAIVLTIQAGAGGRRRVEIPNAALGGARETYLLLEADRPITVHPGGGVTPLGRDAEGRWELRADARVSALVLEWSED